MPRLTLQQCRESRLPEVIGACTADTPAIAAAVNAAQQRLIFAKEVGEEGWYGTWARMVFNVLRSDPYVTLGRYAARIQEMSVCRNPVAIQNEFYEFLEFGNGLQPKYSCSSAAASGCQPMQSYSRGDVVTFRDLSSDTGKYIRVRALSSLDVTGTKRTLIQGTDIFDNILYSQDGAARVVGEYLTLADPFVDAPTVIKTLNGIQKDITNGPVQYWEVDPSTGAEVLLLTMEPSERIAGYRRYYINGLPSSCCPVIRDAVGNPLAQVEGLVKLNLIPVVVDSDYLLIQNMEALIAECQSMRYSTMDLPNAKLMSAAAHRDAIRLLQGELAHHMGIERPAVGFFPFGSARLEKQAIGRLM